MFAARRGLSMCRPRAVARLCTETKAKKRIPVWDDYVDLLEKFPVPTKCLTSAFITGVGDTACQKMVEKNESLDLKRLGIMTFLGGALVGPVLHVWYGALGTMIKIPGKLGTAVMLGLDQFAFAPVFVGTFISSVCVLEGKSDQISAALDASWWDAVKMNWYIWIPAQAINFALIPLQFRVLFANVVALAWNTYLSWASHK